MRDYKLFRKTVKNSFNKVKEDISAFKESMTSWILKFQRENDALKDEVSRLNKKVERLETELIQRKFE